MKKIANILVPAILLGTPAVASNFSRLNSRQKNRKTVSVSEFIENKNSINQPTLKNLDPFDGFNSSKKITVSNKKEKQIDALAFLKSEGLLKPREQRENYISGERKEFSYSCYAGAGLCVPIAITQCPQEQYFATNDSCAPAPTIDSDGNLTISSTIDESSMILIPSTADTFAEKVDIFDFTIIDGGTDDGFSTDITQIDLNTSGTADFSKVTWVLNGNDVSDKNGTFNSSSNILSFDNLNISVDDNSSETYKISGYFSNNRSLKDNATFGLSLNGSNIETNSSKTQFGSTPTITNNENAKVDITATKLYFYILPNR
jgi:hypothetical protein